MSKVGAKIDQAAGYVEEELGETLGNATMADKGRTLRNKGLIEDGKFPKVTPPGTTK